MSGESGTPEAPIWVWCEGSGRRVHGPSWAGVGICAMCGEEVAYLPEGPGDANAIDHCRRDVLAMIDRGDFDV